MSKKPDPPLKRGWTTGACATAATKAALQGMWGAFPTTISITLPRGETPEVAVVNARKSAEWAEAGIIKDAGDDPDVTHGASAGVSA